MALNHNNTGDHFVVERDEHIGNTIGPSESGLSPNSAGLGQPPPIPSEPPPQLQQQQSIESTTTTTTTTENSTSSSEGVGGSGRHSRRSSRPYSNDILREQQALPNLILNLNSQIQSQLVQLRNTGASSELLSPLSTLLSTHLNLTTTLISSYNQIASEKIDLLDSLSSLNLLIKSKESELRDFIRRFQSVQEENERLRRKLKESRASKSNSGGVLQHRADEQRSNGSNNSGDEDDELEIESQSSSSHYSSLAIKQFIDKYNGLAPGSSAPNDHQLIYDKLGSISLCSNIPPHGEDVYLRGRRNRRREVGQSTGGGGSTLKVEQSGGGSQRPLSSPHGQANSRPSSSLSSSASYTRINRNKTDHQEAIIHHQAPYPHKQSAAPLPPPPPAPYVVSSQPNLYENQQHQQYYNPTSQPPPIPWKPNSNNAFQQIPAPVPTKLSSNGNGPNLWSSLSRAFSKKSKQLKVSEYYLSHSDMTTGQVPIYGSPNHRLQVYNNSQNHHHQNSEFQLLPMRLWNERMVYEWIYNYIGISGKKSKKQRNSYQSSNHNIKSGLILLQCNDNELVQELGLTNSLHLKKLRLHIEIYHRNGIGGGGNDVQSIPSPVLNMQWILYEFLPFIGLSQYQSNFYNSLIDGLVLDYMSPSELSDVLKIKNKLHIGSIMSGRELLRGLGWRWNDIKGHGSLQRESDPINWSNEDVVQWLINGFGFSEEFIEDRKLRVSGLHGALLILDPNFNFDIFTSVIGLGGTSSSKNHGKFEEDSIKTNSILFKFLREEYERIFESGEMRKRTRGARGIFEGAMTVEDPKAAQLLRVQQQQHQMRTNSLDRSAICNLEDNEVSGPSPPTSSTSSLFPWKRVVAPQTMNNAPSGQLSTSISNKFGSIKRCSKKGWGKVKTVVTGGSNRNFGGMQDPNSILGGGFVKNEEFFSPPQPPMNQRELEMDAIRHSSSRSATLLNNTGESSNFVRKSRVGVEEVEKQSKRQSTSSNSGADSKLRSVVVDHHHVNEIPGIGGTERDDDEDPDSSSSLLDDMILESGISLR